ncbi:uncharacterized protein F4822DRAFT_435412 [Hypoxylon trugodes]|uniref:uncharacterized protein n=1 Tax=Hypoxylon trugodes TaxID=326681 RepID=UPI002197C7CB|nr:uncharacterized protein F4822DRAFT_435412 [Hypoxylon trugodes]KAI1382603.1 hypothetical protein F4822DRAFT_435412 [Hypoxylon trugodes]
MMHSAQLSGRNLDWFFLEGPYGKDLRLETYETVILIGEGIGIAGILPYALHLAHRRQHDEKFKTTNTPLYKDVTRKVDLLWKLDKDEEENWRKDQLTEIMHLDAKKVRPLSLVPFSLTP